MDVLRGSVIYANSSLRADAGVLGKNRRGQSGLWGYAISGDLPIVLLQIGDLANIDLVRQLVQAHAYWRLKGLTVDLVIWNEDRAGYRQLLQEQIMGLIAAGVEAHVMDRPGGIFVRRRNRYRMKIAFWSNRSRAPSSATGGERWGTKSTGAACMEVRAPHLNLPRFKPSRAHRADLPATDTSAAPRSALLQRARRLHPRWARVRHHDRARAA